MKKALLAYVAIGLLVYARILNAWFVADDWDFLLLVAKAKSALVCFTPLVGRFLRPLVVGTYYVNYQLFGLRPFPYHLTLVVINGVNAWIAYLLAARLGVSQLPALGAGLIFLLFAGHSEAVAWPAGGAEPWLVLLLGAALLVFDRALMAERGAWPLAGACAITIACLLAKETGVTGPAFLLLWGGARLLEPAPAAERRRITIRTLIAVAITALVAAVYLAIRLRIFGTVIAVYSQMGATQGIAGAATRAFVLRAVLPPGRFLVGLWLHRYDAILFAALAAFVAVVFVRRADARRRLAFLVPAFFVALAPALPLSISLMNSVSERYVYAATLFSSILLASIAEFAFSGRRLWTIATILLFAAIHVRALQRSNRLWADAGVLAHTETWETIETVRQASPLTRALVLNTPDTAAGVFVIRGAFYNSFHLMAQDVRNPEGRLGMIASTALTSAADAAHVERTAPRSFTIALARGVFLPARDTNAAEYRIDSWTDQAYAITFRPAPHPIQVLYSTEGHVRTAAVLPASPIGSLDIPADGAVCSGESLRFSGWALSGATGVEVRLERIEAEGASAIGTATWRSGTRPDVSSVYRELPNAARAEWNYLLPCGTVRSAGGTVVVRAVAFDPGGGRTELGARTVTAK